MNRKLLCTIWFGISAFFAAFPIFLKATPHASAFKLSFGTLSQYLILPIFIGIILGFIWGPKILDYSKNNNAFKAILVGIGASLLALVIIDVLFFLKIYYGAYQAYAQGSITYQRAFGGSPFTFFLLLLIGSLFAGGWYVIIFGGLSAYLLYVCNRLWKF